MKKLKKLIPFFMPIILFPTMSVISCSSSSAVVFNNIEISESNEKLEIKLLGKNLPSNKNDYRIKIEGKDVLNDFNFSVANYEGTEIIFSGNFKNEYSGKQLIIFLSNNEDLKIEEIIPPKKGDLVTEIDSINTSFSNNHQNRVVFTIKGKNLPNSLIAFEIEIDNKKIEIPKFFQNLKIKESNLEKLVIEFDYDVQFDGQKGKLIYIKNKEISKEFNYPTKKEI